MSRKDIEDLLRRLPARGIHPSAIGDGAVAGYVLTLGTDLVAEWSAAGAGVGALDDLSDVTITAAASGDILQYNGAAWVDVAFATAAGAYLTTASAASTYLPLAGGTMAGNIAMGSNKLTGLAAGTAAGHSLRYEQLFDASTLALGGHVSIPYNYKFMFGNTSGQSQAEMYNNELLLFSNAVHTYPKMTLGQTSISFGAGDASALDVSLSRTAADELTLAAGDVLKHDTPAENDNSTKSATTEYVERATGNASSNRPTASAYFTADTSHATSGSLLLVTWTAEEHDTDGMYSTSSNPSRMYAMTTGTYNISACISFNVSSLGGRYMTVRKNSAGSNSGGTLVGYVTNEEASASFYSECVLSKNVQLTAGDYIEVFAYQNSTAALNMMGGVGRSYLTMAWVGGTGAAWGNAGASVYNVGNQSCANGTETLLTFDSELFDIDGMHSTSSNTSRLTCVTPGTYQVSGYIAFDANATGVRYLALYKNGALVGYPSTIPASSAGVSSSLALSHIIQLVVGEYLEVKAYQSSGGALNVFGGSSRTVFSAVRVGYQVNPQKVGQQLTSGFAKRTTNMAAAASGNAVSITVTGDGVNPVKLTGQYYAVGSPSSGTGVDATILLLDNTTALAQQVHDLSSTNAYNGGLIEIVVPAFTGSKTFHLAFTASTGNVTWYSATTAPSWIRATWAAGYDT